MPTDTNLGAWDAGQAGRFEFPGSRPYDIKAPAPLTAAELARGPMTDDEFRRLMPLCWLLAQETQ